MSPTVELVYDRDCPNVRAARAAILRAFAGAGLAPRWTEWDRGAADSPDHVRAFGSPTVLVDGRDVAEAEPASDGSRCRLYQEAGRLRPFPPAERIARALAAGAGEADGAGWPGTAGRHGVLPGLLGVGGGVFPTCPACWPAFAGVLSAAGAGFLMEEWLLLPVTGALLALTLFVLGRGARRRRGYGPLGLGAAGVGLIATANFVLASDALLYGGLALVVAGSVWNAWPRGGMGGAGCPACASAPHEGGMIRGQQP